MTVTMTLRVILIAATMGFVGLVNYERPVVPSSYGFISSVEARVGRPLTPVSAAGVARPTVRRCVWLTASGVIQQRSRSDYTTRNLVPT